MSRRRVGILVGILLLIFPSQFTVTYAANIGSKACTKAGKEKVIQGTPHQCVRKKGKLVWVPKSTKATGPVKTPSSQVPSKEKISPSTVSRTSKLGEPFTSAEYPIIANLASEIALEKSRKTEGKFEIEWDTSTTIKKRGSLKDQIDQMEAIYGPMIPEGGLIKIIVIGSNVEWAQERLRIATVESPDFYRDYGNKFVVSKKCAAPEGYVIPDNTYPEPFTSYRGIGGGTVPGQGLAFLTMSNCDNYVEQDILFHEAFHSVQWLNSYTSAKFLGNQAFGWGRVPPWFKEGQAQYFGFRMSEKFKKQSVIFDRDEAILSNLGSQGWKSNYELLSTYKTSTPYWIGALLYEYLLAKFGLDKTLLVFDATVKRDQVGGFEPENRYGIFDEAFLEVFGQSRESFLTEATTYVDWIVEQALASKQKNKA